MLKLTDNERLALKYIVTPPTGAPSLPPAVMEIAPALAEMGLISLRGGSWSINANGKEFLADWVRLQAGSQFVD